MRSVRAFCLFLSISDYVKNETFMKIAVITLLILLTVAVSLAQVVNNRRYREMQDVKGILSPYVLLSAVLFLVVDLAFSSSCDSSLMTCLMFSLTGMFLLTSSLWEADKIRRWAVVAVAGNVFLSIWQIVSVTVLSKPIPDTTTMLFTGCMLVCLDGLFIAGLASRVRSVKSVMKTGTVWANVGLGTDAFYLLVCTGIVSMYFCISAAAETSDGVHAAIAALLLGGEMVAYGYRILNDSLFVLWRKQEQRIVESLKVTSVESASDMSRIDEVYKDIYERVVAYFEREKPFLHSELTMNDLVKVLYSNKLYISRAISQFTGRNFCQFVNYYRIKYSTECFKANHDLKIHEISSMSGFNSIVTFNMAFRLYMGENPSDWCRKEKGRYVKGKK